MENEITREPCREFADRLNQWSGQKIPFLFVVDFEKRKPVALRMEDIDPGEMLYDINGFTNAKETGAIQSAVKEIIRKIPISSEEYERKFNKVLSHLAFGDSFLTNLTIDTEVELRHSLKELFFISKAKYKLWYKDQFLVFSPETFVRIQDGKIFSYPMKGTIDASLPNAEDKILADKKELAEHVTIVDLIRNDLSQVAQEVSVSRFRYVDKLKTNQKTLLQVSSEVTGQLSSEYTSRLGDILITLLPAGSVSGAPKPRTLDIIRETEGTERGYYTGVFGYFDGKKLDSGVMIRFIERRADRYFYRSGGGITTQSFPDTEYQEAIDKVYVPVN